MNAGFQSRASSSMLYDDRTSVSPSAMLSSDDDSEQADRDQASRRPKRRSRFRTKLVMVGAVSFGVTFVVVLMALRLYSIWSRRSSTAAASYGPAHDAAPVFFRNSANSSRGLEFDRPGDCYYNCEKAGWCEWCGEGMACCRQGRQDDPSYCAGYGGSTWQHQCVSIPADAGGQCGGYGYVGPTSCPPGYACKVQSHSYSECQLATAVRAVKQPYQKCAGFRNGLAWQLSCTEGHTCTNLDKWESRCLPSRLMNPGQDCHSTCMGAGDCSWCGHGNACCRHGNDDPPECSGVHFTSFDKYICTVPVVDVRVKHEGLGCWYQCGGSGDCKWCGDGNACCRADGWWPDSPECMEVNSHSKQHDHVCVEPVRNVVVKHQKKSCWDACGGAGFCDWCGNGNACCRFGATDDPLECQGIVDFSATNKYVCAAPVVKAHHVRINPKEPHEVTFDGVAFGDHGKIRGLAGQGGHIDQLWMAGADAIRTWTLEQTAGSLDLAQTNGIKVAAGVYVTQEKEKYEGDYCSLNNGWWQLEAKKIVNSVMRYSRHEALLCWLIGNEMELNVNWASGNDCMWRRLEWLVAKVKSADKHHPVGYALAGYHFLKVAKISWFVTSLDFLGLNVYGGDASNIRKSLKWAGWNKPYAMTEYGSGGAWMVPTTPWGAPVEATSSQKAYQYKQAYNICLSDSKCIGTFMFLWGWKWEATPTWFSLFNEWRAAGVDEAASEVVDVIYRAYTGKESRKPAPSIASVKVFDEHGKPHPPGVGLFVQPGAVFKVELSAVEYPHDSDDDWQDNEIVWVLAEEQMSGDFNPAGDTVLPAIHGVISACGDKRHPRSQLSAIVDTSKLQSGKAYRLYVFVRDNVNAPGNEQVLSQEVCCPTCRAINSSLDRECDEAIKWAMSSGIHEHPEWYPGLTAKSMHSAFQYFFFKQDDQKCPQPCQQACHDPAIGDECDTSVRWTIDQGVNLHPEWYPGLTTTSSYRDAQLYFHEKTNECPRPCKKRANVTEAYANIPFKICHDHHKHSNDPCAKMVREAMQDPSKYGLNEGMDFRQVQKALAQLHNETCAEPCDICEHGTKGSTCEGEISKVRQEVLGTLQSPYSASFPWTSFEEFQGTLHRNGKNKCPQPCALRVRARGGRPTCHVGFQES